MTNNTCPSWASPAQRALLQKHVNGYHSTKPHSPERQAWWEMLHSEWKADWELTTTIRKRMCGYFRWSSRDSRTTWSSEDAIYVESDSEEHDNAQVPRAADLEIVDTDAEIVDADIEIVDTDVGIVGTRGVDLIESEKPAEAQYQDVLPTDPDATNAVDVDHTPLLEPLQLPESAQHQQASSDEPKADIFRIRSTNLLLITAELPGFYKSEISLFLRQGDLHIVAQRETDVIDDQDIGKGVDVGRGEGSSCLGVGVGESGEGESSGMPNFEARPNDMFAAGRLTKRIPLADGIQVEEIDATFERGVLMIECPLKSTRRTVIPIKDLGSC